MKRKNFNSNGIFWLVTIIIDNGEVLFYKESDDVDNPFYYFSFEDFKTRYIFWEQHLKDKVWFTDEMFTFITSEIIAS